MIVSSLREANFNKIYSDLAFIIECLHEVLNELGEAELAQALPWQNGAPTLLNVDTEAQPSQRTAQIYSIAFQLLNMVEENAAVQMRRLIETEGRLDEVSGLWQQNLQRLQKLGLTDQEIAADLAKIRVEPVLTAHPTEAKRATVLEHHRRLYLLLVQRENSMWTQSERAENRAAIKAELERLWRTGEIYLEKPDIAAERRNILYYLRNIFPQALPEADRRLRAAWESMGFDPTLVETPDQIPRLTFGNWVGGDRDGHPLVSAAVTQQTLDELRRNALELLREQLIELAVCISLSEHLQRPPAELLARLDALATGLGAAGEQAIARNPDEPWRQFVNLLLAKLPFAHAEITSDRALYSHADELTDDLMILRQSLLDVSAERLARMDVDPLLRTVQTFGFQLAALDIRQNSRFHDLAVGQLMAAAGLAETNFADWDEAQRLAFLQEELQSPRPFSRPGMQLGPEAAAVVSCHQTVVNHSARYGFAGLGALIVSMTRSLSDLLAVYLLALEAGLTTQSEDGLVCQLPVVPLFETIDDLRAAPEILDAFLSHPLTQRSLAMQQARQGLEQPVQQVMVGYSDSNKDGGIFASLWNLHLAETALADVGRRHAVRIRFFHGRGGTISRGAGPTHRFINALPHSTLNGDLRMTEQGETIAQKYANRLNGAYNLELLLAGTAGATLRHWHTENHAHPLEPVMGRLAEKSRAAYADLLQSEGFVTFFRQATPIDAIEASRIGSRPARRTGQQTLADLRAIPWVFSWGQARFYLSGWYGVGTALEWLLTAEPAAFAQVCAQNLQWSPLHYIISNAATSVVTADVAIMQEYAALVTDVALRERLMTRILDEHQRTVRMLEEIYGGPLAERRADVHDLLALRRPGLSVLHRQQIDLLRRWRAGDDQAQQQLELELIVTVNAIAGGLGATG